MRRILTLLLLIILCGAAATSGVFITPNRVRAEQSEVDRLKTEIGARNDRLGEIEKEIAQYQTDLKKVGAQKKTLQNTIDQLELERKKISADLSYTENKIGFTDLEISKINIEIDGTTNDINKNQRAIDEVIARIGSNDKESLLETFLRHNTLSEFWGDVTTLDSLRGTLGDEVKKQASLKALLESKRNEQQDKRSRLLDLKNDYSDQKQILENNKSEKARLLSDTKNKEANYQAILAAKKKARETIVKELRTFESQLKFILDPNSIPKPGTAVFAWPVTNVIITQLFGGTEFAKAHSSVYAGRAYHPGVDFGVPRGTKIYAPLAGTVRATGNTDAVPGCYSWGKWTLIDHQNGLATLYAHQDKINVSPGESVEQGTVIGYSGNTGYSTGPHLHFTVYAKAGVTVRKFSEIKTATNCGAATTPVAATTAYLDPMLYLPKP